MRLITSLILAIIISGCTWQRPTEIPVKKGDTLYSLAKSNNMTIADLIELNELKAPYIIKVGQVLKIPSQNAHKVEKGDTLYSIARDYDIDFKHLSSINGIVAPYTIHVGQMIALHGQPQTIHATPSSKPSLAQSTKSYTPSSKKPTQASLAPTPSKKPSKTVASSSKKPTQQASKPVSTKRHAKFMWPVKGTVISKYGTIGKGRSNDGINIKAAKGTPVKSADSGVVAYAGNALEGFGNLILIKHYDGYITAYAHNDKFLIKKGQKVSRGQQIATVGMTGGVNTPQLHFEIRAGKDPVNPIYYLQ